MKIPAAWALVTAGGGGLGAAIAEHLMRRGIGVVVHFHTNDARATRMQAEASARGETLLICQGDLRKAEDRLALVRFVERECGSLGVLVNNLGVYPEVGLLETTLETWADTFELSCTTVFHLTQLCLPLLRNGGASSRVVNLGDSGCDRIEARAEATPYHIAKVGTHILTRTYAQLLMNEGITVNMISPGFLENSVGTPDEALPTGRPGRFEDILSAMDFILSDAASTISGTNLLVSGAWNLG